MAKQRLGRGLNALIPEIPDEVEQGVQEVEITAITPNRNQPRQNFDKEKLEELAQSISQHGIVQPVLLRKVERGYEIVAGERRWRAARMAGMKAIPAVVKELDDRQVMELALIENLQREDLHPLEEAEAYRKLADEFGLTQEEISSAVGKSRPAVANALRLLTLPDPIKKLLFDNLISAGHGRALLPLEEKQQVIVAEKIIKENLSVRDTERIVNEIASGKKPVEKKKEEKQPWVLEMENILGEYLGTKVQIIPGRKKGKLEIEYYSPEDLERILEIIKQ
ncbi:MAG: Chromosome (plasmid) partitioning protein ParB [Firmicutes bacterium]|nr:Chromosome (plasmid) partitioning protein ParB [Bacillota bacterium]MDI6706657.1 ParB/RepB/Spo0J family partition protein [Bacillota bacterium]